MLPDIGSIVFKSSTASVCCDCSLFDFFRELPVVYGKLAQYIETNQLSVQQLEEVSSVKEWQKMLVTLSLLAKKYKDLFSRYLCHLKYSKATAQRFGWMLYLVLKSKVLPRFPDLVSCMELLVCVINLMVAHSNKLPHGMPLAADNVLDTLTVISDGLKTNTDQVFRLQMSVNTLVSQLLSDCLKGSSQENVDLPTGLRTDCVQLPGLLSDHEATSSAMSLLEREYDAVYSHQGELDERDFLATDMARFASPRMSPATAYNSSAPLHRGGRSSIPSLQQLAPSEMLRNCSEPALQRWPLSAWPCSQSTSSAAGTLPCDTVSPATVPAVPGLAAWAASARRMPAPASEASPVLQPVGHSAPWTQPLQAFVGGCDTPPTGAALCSPAPCHTGSTRWQLNTQNLTGLASQTNRLGPGTFSTVPSPTPSPGGPAQQLCLLAAAKQPQAALLQVQAASPTPQVACAPEHAVPCPPTPGRQAAGPAYSPLPSMHLGSSQPSIVTPITETMGSAAWLRSVTQPLPLGPSATLKVLLAACQPDPSPVIAGRIAEMVGLVLPDEQPAQLLAFPVIHQTAAQERRAEATKLYYLVLERVITEECKRTGHTQLARPFSAVVPPQCQDAPTELSTEGNTQSDLTAAARVAYCALLNSTNFHKGLVACCLEVVIASYRMVSAAFPKVLDALQLQAFDLSKIVQPFVKHMPGLPLELKRHLFWIEERIIESLAWERGSRLYDVLAATHVSSNSAVLQRSAACKPSMPQLSQGHAVAAQEAPTAPAQGDGEATASHALSMGRMKISSPDHQEANGQTTMQPPSQQATVGGPPGSLTLQPECSSLGGTLLAGVPASPKRTPDLASFVSPAKRVRSHEGTVSSLAAQSSPAQGGAVSAPSDPGAQGLSHATCSLGQRSAAACDTLPPQPAKASGWQASPDTPPTCCVLQPLPAGVGQPLTAAALAAMPPSAASALSVTHDFLRKALKLAWFRLGWLCQALSGLPLPLSPAELRQRVYDTVEHALYQHTCLLYNRHLDQIVLCALYGYCKVHKMANISFKEIIVHYRRQPQASQTVFRSVVLKQSLPELQVLARGDIIAFYNQLFVPLMKQFLLRDGGTAPTGLPPIPPPCAALPSQQMLRGSPARHPPPMPGTGAPSVPSPCPAHPKTAPRPPLAASPLGLPPSHPTPTKQLPGNSLIRLSPRTGVGMQPAQGPGAAPAALAAGAPVSGPDRTQQVGQLVQTVTGFFPALSSKACQPAPPPPSPDGKLAGRKAEPAAKGAAAVEVVASLETARSAPLTCGRLQPTDYVIPPGKGFSFAIIN
ncbi:hypothetical protein V8C86DRAFT_2737461 [Haematococcus lacustris]